MPEPSRFQLVVTVPARRDIAAIVRWSLREFGVAAALRYEALIEQALRDIEADPDRAGSTELPVMVAGARTYHLSFSRDRVAGVKVKSPRHLVLYRRSSASLIEVGRILHDGRDVALHLPAAYRPAAPPEGE